LAARQDVRLGSAVSQVIDHGRLVEVTWHDGDGEHTERVDRCLITTTTDLALAMYPQMAGIQREFYESTRYIASVNTHLKLSRRPSNPTTYVMASPCESPDMCCVIVDHPKAANRVPRYKGMITVFCRHGWYVKNMDAADQSVIDQVLGFVKPRHGDLGDTLEDVRIGRWPRVVPVMPQGRFKIIAAY
jgi:protoporphyrinogen oxidase